jgi:DNA polymerase III delta prime subunit
MMKRLCYILDTESVVYDKSVLVELIKKHYPDWRRVINELQRYSATGKIDSGLLANITETSLKSLVGNLKDKDFTSMRKWVADNIDSDSTAIFRTLYDSASQFVTKNTVPNLVMIISKYQYQAAFVADHEINLTACLTEMMIDLEYL